MKHDWIPHMIFDLLTVMMIVMPFACLLLIAVEFVKQLGE